MTNRTAGLLILLLLLVAGCASAGRSQRTPGAVSALEAVESFLRLANERDYHSMGLIFGTSAGAFSAQTDAAASEQRMYLFSCLLRHDSREIRSEQPVPGSLGRAVRFDVNLRSGTWEQVVPFRAVQGPQNRWFVEDVRIDQITGSNYPTPSDCRRPARG